MAIQSGSKIRQIVLTFLFEFRFKGCMKREKLKLNKANY